MRMASQPFQRFFLPPDRLRTASNSLHSFSNLFFSSHLFRGISFLSSAHPYFLFSGKGVHTVCRIFTLLKVTLVDSIWLQRDAASFKTGETTLSASSLDSLSFANLTFKNSVGVMLYSSLKSSGVEILIMLFTEFTKCSFWLKGCSEEWEFTYGFEVN